MNDKEAIERLNRFKTIKVMYGNTFAMHLEQLKQLQQDLEIVLNLLEKQKAEIEEKDKSLKLHKKLEYQYKNDYLNVIEDLEKKDKMIDLMAEKFEDLKLAYLKKEDGGEFFGKYRTYNKNEWKQYFERKVENE